MHTYMNSHVLMQYNLCSTCTSFSWVVHPQKSMKQSRLTLLLHCWAGPKRLWYSPSHSPYSWDSWPYLMKDKNTSQYYSDSTPIVSPCVCIVTWHHSSGHVLDCISSSHINKGLWQPLSHVTACHYLLSPRNFVVKKIRASMIATSSPRTAHRSVTKQHPACVQPPPQS